MPGRSLGDAMPPPALLVLPGCAIQAISPPCLGMPLLFYQALRAAAVPKTQDVPAHGFSALVIHPCGGPGHPVMALPAPGKSPPFRGRAPRGCESK